jgi:nucleotide-binding universal stress UspA family protein
MNTPFPHPSLRARVNFSTSASELGRRAAGIVMRKLLAAVDFSPVSKAVVEQAASLARAYSAELTIVFVEPPDSDFVSYDVDTKPIRDERASEIRKEHRELHAMADELRARGITAKAIFLRGAPVEKIVEEATRLGADTIVIGSHRHGAIHRALLGSVSEGIVRAARCPILVIPASQ